LRLASCCNVEVMNGAAGRRVRRSTERTKSAPSSALASRRCSSNGLRGDQLADRAKSRQSPRLRVDRRLEPPGSKLPTRSQLGGPKLDPLRSRSTTSLVATDCTRPAVFITFFHKTGETS
jgi:hypothetical protein